MVAAVYSPWRQTHPKPFNTTVAITGQVVAAAAAIYVLSIKNKIMRL